MFGEGKSLGGLLSSLNFSRQDARIFIRESRQADANFVITALLGEAVREKSAFCLLALHNNAKHYQTVGKKLGYDLGDGIEKGRGHMLEAQRLIFEGPHFLSAPELAVKNLYVDLKNCIEESRRTSPTVYLVVDDLSHLFDLGLDVAHVLNFACCLLKLSDERVKVVLGSHVADKPGEILANFLCYGADAVVEVGPVKAGKCSRVSGVATVTRRKGGERSTFYYRTYEKGVRTFYAGESLGYLYK